MPVSSVDLIAMACQTCLDKKEKQTRLADNVYGVGRVWLILAHTSCVVQLNSTQLNTRGIVLLVCKLTR
jgi:hypothetical protein